jgi:hypothetical protein
LRLEITFVLGMAGQVAYHLLAQSGAARAPWPVTTIVSCLPVLVLAMGTTLVHMLRADTPADTSDGNGTGPVPAWSQDRSAGDQSEQDQDHATDGGSGPPEDTRPLQPEPATDARTSGPKPSDTRPETDRARLIALSLAAAKKPVSRRALRSAGVKGSNESLNALARKVNAELAAGALSDVTVPDSPRGLVGVGAADPSP